MKTHSILLLGSKSPSRQMLLKEAQIPFELVSQDADEAACDWGLPLIQLVRSIALHKMEHVLLPAGTHIAQHCFVLTADTLSQDLDGTIQGKPVDKADAIEKLRTCRAGSRLATSFCLDRRSWDGATWQVEERLVQEVSAEYQFVIPDGWIETYLRSSIGMETANAIAIEGFGGQFLKTISGSYSTIVGLPLFELRQALENIGFFDDRL